MTDNDIIKASECCGCDNYQCDNCPYAYKTCTVYKDSIDLINRQKAEIERLREETAELIDDRYATQLLCHLIKKEDDTRNVRSDAIKEFAERLKNAFPEGNRDNKCPAIYIDDYCYIIDECAEEMVGDNNAE